MKILLHICCAPCAIYPLRVLRKEGHDVQGLFYNPNIHPYSEYTRRFDTLVTYAEATGMHLVPADEYTMEEFLRNVVFREKERCRYCYYSRLKYTAHVARRGKFDRFTSTLLYSKFQDHELIKELGGSIGREVGIPFFAVDFREGWKEGIDESKRLGMYRQQYCGCIYSEKERYYRNAAPADPPGKGR